MQNEILKEKRMDTKRFMKNYPNPARGKVNQEIDDEYFNDKTSGELINEVDSDQWITNYTSIKFHLIYF